MAKEPAKGEKGKPATKERRPKALKRDMQNKRLRLHNRSFKSSVRTAIRHFEEHLEKEDTKAIKTSLNTVYSLLDKGVKTGVFKLNTASRTKARLAARAAAKTQ